MDAVPKRQILAGSFGLEMYTRGKQTDSAGIRCRTSFFRQSGSMLCLLEYPQVEAESACAASKRTALYSVHKSSGHASPARGPESRKTIKLNETVPLLKQALRAYERGRIEEGSDLLRRHADALLIEAARKQDLDYYAEAEIVEKLRYHYGITFTTYYHNRQNTMLSE